MTDVLLKPLDRSALRLYGTWGEADAYAYRPQGQAAKRFTWTCPAVAVGGDAPAAITLTYFADAIVEAKRMGDLTYLAERERDALDTLEAMVLAAINGTGYLGLPHPGAEITQDVVGLVGQWVTSRGHPETWEQDLAITINAAIDRLNAWQRMLVALGAVPDTEHAPSWGMAIRVGRIEPKEPA